MTDFTTANAIELIQAALQNIHTSLDSAMQFHSIKRHEQVQEETFVRSIARQQTPQEHDQRAQACAKNRQVIEELQQVMSKLEGKLKAGEDVDRINRAIVKILKDSFEKGHWQQGLFFRANGEKLLQLENTCRTRLLEKSVQEPKKPEHVDEYTATAEDQVLVYVSLYQADGSVLQKWEVIVNTLADHVAGRPIFCEEQDIKAHIRSKPVPQNDAYVVLAVSSKALLAQDAEGPLQDKEGRAMVQIKKVAVTTSAIRRFVHMNESYILRDGQLVKLG